jgi:hypothetical protein
LAGPVPGRLANIEGLTIRPPALLILAEIGNGGDRVVTKRADQEYWFEFIGIL